MSSPLNSMISDSFLDEIDVGQPQEIKRCKIICDNENKSFLFCFDSREKEVTFGRIPSCDIVVNDIQISRQHCKIYLTENDKFLLKDLSSNGTFVNGKLVGKDKMYCLTDKDKISFCKGKFSYSFLMVSQDPMETDGIHELYDILGDLGSGTSGVVKKATDKKTGKLLAIKMIRKKSNVSSKFTTREVNILKRVDHPHIIRYENIIDGLDHLYIVLEYVSGGDLFTRISRKKLSENTSKRIFKQILYGVQYLHQNNIVHRDLKPENILLDQLGNVKVTDFGLATITNENAQMITVCGTPHYLAPEIVKFASNYTVTGYSVPVDMWSLGVILYLLLSGTWPFSEELVRNMSLYEQIETATYEFPQIDWDGISEDAKDLIRHLLVVDPEERYTATKALEHGWLKETKKRKDSEEISEESALGSKNHTKALSDVLSTSKRSQVLVQGKNSHKKRKTESIEEKLGQMDLNKENSVNMATNSRITSQHSQVLSSVL